MRSVCLLAWLMLSLPLSAAAVEPDDCSLKFAGSSRKALKNRAVDTATKQSYTKHNSGSPISVANWYGLVCDFDGELPADISEISETKPLPDIETIEITVQGFILAAQFEKQTGPKGPDNDFHMELSGSKKWNSDHVIVEVPPGKQFCDARKVVADAIRADNGNKSHVPLKYKFKKPIEVEVTGYVFFDAYHARGCIKKGLDYCQCDGGRGSKSSGKSKVKGLWEIHPVTSIKLLSE
jgi:hypothetical protein